MGESKNQFISPFYSLSGENLHLAALKFVNGYFVTISEKEALKLGTIAISLPFSAHLANSKRERVMEERTLANRGATTTNVIGTRNEIFVKALAEKIVALSHTLVLISINFQENNEQLFLEAIQLVEKLLKMIQ